MLDSFLTFINQQVPALKQERTLLTVSGGIDSVVMAHLFHQLGLGAGIAHCNFGLRGEESEGDEQFVHELARSYSFPFFSKRFDVKSFAKENGVSIQMAARELRYEWFEEIREQNSFQWIATAHHANDSLETALLNLVRGTGLSGLHGISGINKHLVRPLILATKDEILAYAQANGLAWREDRSNASDDYKRNLIRHKVVPVLKRLNPSLEATFSHSSVKLQNADRLLNGFLDTWAEGIIVKRGNQVRISKAKLLSESEPAYKLWHVLDQFGFSYQQSVKIIASMSGISGRQFLSDSHILLIDREDLIIQEKADTQEVSDLSIDALEGEFQLGILSLHLTQRARDSSPRTCYESNTVILDVKKLKFPLSVRKWKTGDVFQPLGMKGKKKKLSDFFTDLKLDLFTKSNTYILLNGNQEIIWVIGRRLDERYRIDEDAVEVLEVRLIERD
jgi:tRNA(Ile)-lysidine synthase